MVGVVVMVVVEFGVVVVGEGVGMDVVVWCCFVWCVVILLELMIWISYIVLFIGMGFMGVRLGGGWWMVVSGENMMLRSLMFLKLCGIWLCMS